MGGKAKTSVGHLFLLTLHMEMILAEVRIFEEYFMSQRNVLEERAYFRQQVPRSREKTWALYDLSAL